jgi:hypothetical protein
MSAAVTEFVTLYLFEQVVRRTRKVVMQNDRDLMEVILLYRLEISFFSSDGSRDVTLKQATTTFFPITNTVELVVTTSVSATPLL